jgi:hypothetical protein
MKFTSASTTTALSVFLFGCLFTTTVHGECSATTELEIDSATKLSFTGFQPNVKRVLNTGVGNKVILSGYDYEPVVAMSEDGMVVRVSAGTPCGLTGPGDQPDGTTESGDDTEDPTTGGGEEESSSSSATKLLSFGIPMVLGGQKTGLVSAMTAFTMLSLSSSFLPQVVGQDIVSECELVPIEVEIYVDALADDIVNAAYKTGSEYEACPPETMYWKHHEYVHGGYEGCVAERGLYPCASDALGVSDEEGLFYQQSPVYWDGSQCVETDYTMANKTLWIQWGHPMDKYEISARTELNPVVSFPFNRMPYALYDRGADPMTSQDESNDAKFKAMEMLSYIGAFDMEDMMANWDVVITEGAEQGIVHLWAGKALEIAQTTCNRDIQIFMQVPSYSYSTGTTADIANGFADTFYNSTECSCFATDTCKDPTITVNVVGWLPNTPIPEAMGDDGTMYPANSASPNSPWFESLVFPENPSGVIKTPILPNANRRMCDGVYLWPMYFGARDFVIPKDELPDCAGWSFSISKIYSAAARAGWIMFKKEPTTSHEAVVDTIGTSQTLVHGSLSEWTWHGQLQLFDVFMSRPLDDPTSWIGAYSAIMKEKWDAIMDGFSDCPITQPSNPYSGAYVWFVFQDPFLGIQDSSVPSFFRDVLGVRATTYNWGFRGATPSDYYGEGYGTNDFTRLQMYRDVNVYVELARRAKIVCNDFDAVVSDNFVSVNQWVASAQGTRHVRHLARQDGTRTDPDVYKRALKETVPELTSGQLEYLTNGHLESERQDRAIDACAPDYETSCLFEKIGVHFDDNF